MVSVKIEMRSERRIIPSETSNYTNVPIRGKCYVSLTQTTILGIIEVLSCHGVWRVHGCFYFQKFQVSEYILVLQSSQTGIQLIILTSPNKLAHTDEHRHMTDCRIIWYERLDTILANECGAKQGHKTLAVDLHPQETISQSEHT